MDLWVFDCLGEKNQYSAAIHCCLPIVNAEDFHFTDEDYVICVYSLCPVV